MKQLNNNKTIIVLDGPDALGKTTQAQLLKENLERNNIKVMLRKQPHRNRKKIFDKDTKPIKVAKLTLDEYRTIHNSFMSSDAEVLVLDRCAFSSIPAYNYQKMSFKEVLAIEALMEQMASKYQMPDMYLIFGGEAYRKPDNTVFETSYDREYIETAFSSMVEHRENLKDTPVYKNATIHLVSTNADPTSVADNILEIIKRPEYE